jgi:hypothetical protein
MIDASGTLFSIHAISHTITRLGKTVSGSIAQNSIFNWASQPACGAARFSLNMNVDFTGSRRQSAIPSAACEASYLYQKEVRSTTFSKRIETLKLQRS